VCPAPADASMPFCIVKGEPDDVIRVRCYERATLFGPFDTGVQRGIRIAESVRLWEEASAGPRSAGVRSQPAFRTVNVPSGRRLIRMVSSASDDG
jgi:hypothetical protein